MQATIHRLRRNTISCLAALGLFLTPLVMTVPVHAASATMTLSANPSSVVQSSNVVVTVTVATGSTVSDGAMAKLTFDTAKLQYQSIDYSGSPLNSTDDLSSGVSGGTVSIARYTSTPPGPSGTFKLAAVTFKALANSGTSSPAIDAANSYVSDHSTGNTFAPTATGTTITFTPIPPAAPAPAPSSTTPKSPTTPAVTPVKPSTSTTPDAGPVPAVVGAVDVTPDTSSTSEESTEATATAATQVGKFWRKYGVYTVAGATTVVACKFFIAKYRNARKASLWRKTHIAQTTAALPQEDSALPKL